MTRVLLFAAAAEALTGAALMAAPSVVGRLLLGADLSGVAVPIARVTGIALVALGVASWPGGTGVRALGGMLTYSALVTLYLAYLGMGGMWVGSLLWPAVVIHAILTFLLARAWLKGQRNHEEKDK